jgi:hypothetical protein
MGLSPSRSALIRWSPLKRIFDEVSLPVNATPSQPRSGEKKGKSTPVDAKAGPIVTSKPA